MQLLSGPQNGSAVLGIPDCERFQLLSIKCDTISADWNRGHVKSNENVVIQTKKKFKN